MTEQLQLLVVEMEAFVWNMGESIAARTIESVAEAEKRLLKLLQMLLRTFSR